MTEGDEDARLRALHRCRIVNAPVASVFTRIVADVEQSLGVAVASITLVGKTRSWCKAAIGHPGRFAPRSASFSNVTVRDGCPQSVADVTTDQRFAGNPYVTGEMQLRSYAGAPLLDHRGFPLGAVSVAHTRPRHFSRHEVKSLVDFAARVMLHIELHRLAQSHGQALGPYLLRKADAAYRARDAERARAFIRLIYAYSDQWYSHHREPGPHKAGRLVH